MTSTSWELSTCEGFFKQVLLYIFRDKSEQTRAVINFRGNMMGVGILQSTPPKFNMEPENDGFQKESPFPGTSFQVPC